MVTLEDATMAQMGEKRYSYTLSLTPAPDSVRGLSRALSRLTSGKQTRYPLYRRLDGLQCPV
jgi:hypothetical protein